MRRRLGLGLLALATSASLAAFAIAQTGDPGNSRAQSGDPGSSPELPEHGVRGVGVPEGPFIDFCPTQRQSELHIKLYGGDLKPTVGCNREGELPPPTPKQLADTATDPDEDLSAQDRCKLAKDRWLSGKPLPDADEDPLTIEYETEDGVETAVQVFGDPKAHKGVSIDDFARSVTC